MGNTPSLDTSRYPLIHLSTYPPGIFKSIFTLFISFLSILPILELFQPTPDVAFNPSGMGITSSSDGKHPGLLWGSPQVTMGNTSTIYGKHHE